MLPLQGKLDPHSIGGRLVRSGLSQFAGIARLFSSRSATRLASLDVTISSRPVECDPRSALIVLEKLDIRLNPVVVFNRQMPLHWCRMVSGKREEYDRSWDHYGTFWTFLYQTRG